MRPPTRAPAPLAIARWLLAVAAMVFLMLVVGGITRLTESGLSITRWEPISGAIPPLDAHQWQGAFAAYQATPEYLKINRGMSLDAFKHIFFWEYLHRLIGRTIGMAFALPLLWFAWRRAIPPGYGPRLVALLALGGLQGAIGWWMVASGLVDRPDVSHLRLATHLLAALLIFSGLIWTALDLRELARNPAARPSRMPAIAAAAISILVVQLFLGALTAGLNAGYAYASWPKMGDRWFPSGGWNAAWSAAHNALYNPIVVQFMHRWWAWVVVAAMIVLARSAKRAGDRRASLLIHIAFGTQVVLGVATLLSGVNIVLAAMHQATGALLLASAVNGAHAIGGKRDAAARAPRRAQVAAPAG